MSDTNGSGGASRAPGADDVPAGDAWTAPVPEAGDHGLRRRRVLIVAVLVVVVAGVTVFVAGQGRPVRSTPAASATPVSAPTVAPDRLDPTRQLFRLGFLPGSAGDTSYLSEADTHTVRVVGPGGRTPGAREDGGSSSSSTWAVEVGMAARGIDVHREAREYASELGHDVPGDSVAPVHGRPAFRYETGGTSVLSWQYAPDGWMWVRVTDVDRPAEVARQVAEGVVWETAPLAVPFQAVELPSGAVLAGAHLRWHEGRWLEARARYLLGRPEGNTSFVRPDLVVGVSAKSLAYGGESAADDVTVAGRAATAFDAGNGIGAVYRVAQLPGGCADCVAEIRTATGRGYKAVGGREGALDLAASIRLVDEHENPARWRPL